MWRHFILIIAGVLIGVLSASTSKADFATSTTFQIERGVVDTGGGRATSSGFLLEQSTGQAGTGISTSTSFTLRGGFLYFEAPAAAPAASSAPAGAAVSAPSPGSGGGGGGTGFVLPPFLRHAPLPPEAVAIADFDGDGRVDIVDLSIMLFYYNKSGSEIARYDLNRNNTVDFPDISVLMYYWTG